MTKDEALKIALEALTDFDYDKRMKAIESIKEALETKEWVGLTDEDRYEFAAATYSWEELLIAAETKLKEKNT